MKRKFVVLSIVPSSTVAISVPSNLLTIYAIIPFVSYIYRSYEVNVSVISLSNVHAPPLTPNCNNFLVGANVIDPVTFEAFDNSSITCLFALPTTVVLSTVPTVHVALCQPAAEVSKLIVKLTKFGLSAENSAACIV